jgi:uncharacterized membrane protein YeaQ/YmgE (transglycosylase-associated protein family)
VVTLLVLWLVVGVIAGVLAGRVLSGHGFGVYMDVAAGVIGALLGGYSAGLMGVSTNPLLQVLVALAGAVFMLVLLKAIGFGRGRTNYLY